MKYILFKSRLENYTNFAKDIWNTFAPTCLIMPRRIDAHLAVVAEIKKTLSEREK